MRTRRRATIEELRIAIDCLPRDTRVAMLEGITTNEIIVGAYSDSGGICPMLAAHRAGGRTNMIAFARAWDRYAFRGTQRRGGKRARRATPRELLVLSSHLEASLLAEDAPEGDLRAAIADHRALRERAAVPDTPARAPHRRGERNRARTDERNRVRPGWSWMRIVRRYDDYALALEQLEELGRLEQPESPEPRGTEHEQLEARRELLIR